MQSASVAYSCNQPVLHTHAISQCCILLQSASIAYSCNQPVLPATEPGCRATLLHNQTSHQKPSRYNHVYNYRPSTTPCEIQPREYKHHQTTVLVYVSQSGGRPYDTAQRINACRSDKSLFSHHVLHTFNIAVIHWLQPVDLRNWNGHVLDMVCITRVHKTKENRQHHIEHFPGRQKLNSYFTVLIL